MTKATVIESDSTLFCPLPEGVDLETTHAPAEIDDAVMKRTQQLAGSAEINHLLRLWLQACVDEGSWLAWNRDTMCNEVRGHSRAAYWHFLDGDPETGVNDSTLFRVRNGVMYPAPRLMKLVFGEAD